MREKLDTSNRWVRLDHALSSLCHENRVEWLFSKSVIPFSESPELPAAQDGPFTAEDVDAGIYWRDGVHSHTVNAIDSGPSAQIGNRWFSRQAVAAMLNDAHKRGYEIKLPDGHRLQPKAESTLREVAAEIAVQIRNQGYRASLGEIARQLEAAIEREKAKEVQG